jgi:hypothetical protein
MSEDELQQTRREPRWARFRSRSALVNSGALADPLNRCDASPGSSTRSLKVPRLVELLVEHPAKFELLIKSEDRQGTEPRSSCPRYAPPAEEVSE